MNSKLTWLALSGLLMTVSLLAQTPSARGRDIHFRGPVKEIVRDGSGRPTVVTVRVNRAQVQLTITPWTDVFGARGFVTPVTELRLDDFLEVNGFFTASGEILARQIHIESRDGVDAGGAVELISGDLIRLNGVDFLLDSTTQIRKAGQVMPGSRTEIVAGTLVRLRAAYAAGSLRVRELEYGARTVESSPLRFEGTVRSLNSGLLTVDVGVSSTAALVAIDSNTFISGELAAGRLVEIEGRFLPGTALVNASRITVDANSNGNVYDDDPEDEPSEQAELRGEIRSLSRRSDGSVASITVEQTLVRLTAQTQIQYEDGVAAPSNALEVGLIVEVEGTLLQDNSVQAARIEIDESSPAPEPEAVELEGPIQSLSRVSSGLVERITVEGVNVFLNSATVVVREGAEVSSSELEEGQRVHLRGMAQGDGSVLASEITIEDEQEEGEEVELEGKIQTLTRQSDGSVTQITVKGTPADVNSMTKIKKHGSQVPSSELETGQEVHVKARRQADNRVLATEIEIQ